MNMRNPERDTSNPATIPFVLGVGGLAVGAIAELSGNSGANSLASGADVFGLVGLYFAGVIAGTVRYNRNHYQNQQNFEDPAAPTE